MRISFIKIYAFIFCCLNAFYNMGGILSLNIQSTEILDMEQINGTQNFRIFGKKGKDDKPWFDSRGDMRHIHCVRPGKCELLQYTTCLGSKIPYMYTSLDLTDYFNQNQTQERLKNYQDALQNIPRCWAVIQPFLCAVFIPKCERIKDKEMVYLPSLEMCKITLEPCRILYNTSYFPEFLKCNETLFPSKCNNDVREMKFNITGKCLEPLVATEITSSYYKGIEGCGIQCKDPLYTDDEHRQIRKLVAWCATLCFICNLFVITTFMIDWKNASKYPALIVFYINFCFLISCVGWLVQFLFESREDIVCRKDKTLRRSEPNAEENLSCIAVFALVYYFLTAAMCWFVFLTYAWHLRATGNVQDRIDKKRSYFHLIAWSLPMVLTIAILALSEIDGNSIVGVCFVGYMNHAIRAGFLLGPLCGLIIVSGYFIVRGMIKLFALKNFANDIKSTSASNKIHFIIVRMGICALFTLVFILVTIVCHLNEFKYSALWKESLRNFIICKISSPFMDENEKCKLENRPSVAVLQLHLLCLFGSGILMSSWCWTPATLDTWKRFIRKKCGKEVNEEIKMQKHKVIAQTWAKREELKNKGRLSITLYNTHTDPVGLNFDVNDLNSSVTNEISSTWANYLPQFLKRRFALTGATATNSSSHTGGVGVIGGGAAAATAGPRKSSLDSEISFSVRHFSVESRRNSVDSQVSYKFSEMKTKLASCTRSGGGNGNVGGSGTHKSHHNGTKHSLKSRNKTFAANRKIKYRRESSTSIESQIIALKKTSYKHANQKIGGRTSNKIVRTADANEEIEKSLKRRSANTNLLKTNDMYDIISKGGKFLIPFLQNQGLTTSDEETSRASFKAQDSRLDIFFKKHYQCDDNDYSHQQHQNDVDDDDDDDDNKDSALMDDYEDVDDDQNHCFNDKINLDTLNNKDKFDSCSRNSKNSSKGRNSRKSNRRKIKNLISNNNKKHIGVDMSDNHHKKFSTMSSSPSSSSSYSSELDLPMLTGVLHSSYSGISTSGKPHSRNSKTSCDVGIQTNAYEIVTRTKNDTNDNNDNEHEIKNSDTRNLDARKSSNKSKTRTNDKIRKHFNQVNDNEEVDENGETIELTAHCAQFSIKAGENDDDDADNERELATECHELLPNKQKVSLLTMMSESEKLKMLLLPSK